MITYKPILGAAESGAADYISSQYFPILLFMAVAIGLSCAIILIPFIFAKLQNLARKKRGEKEFFGDQEKLSSYECGFEGEGEVRNEFNVQFYLVAILFIIFDLEIAFLFPWAVSLKNLGVVGFWSMISFLILLTVGFIYEWMRGALEWK